MELTAERTMEREKKKRIQKKRETNSRKVAKNGKHKEQRHAIRSIYKTWWSTLVGLWG